MTDDADAIRDASTVVPLRDGESGLEVFLVRRHSESGFMADRYVYPGGAVDDGDRVDGTSEWVEGLDAGDAAGRLGGDVAPDRAMGHYLAGVRETFEEAGILFARSADSPAFVDTLDEDRVERYRRARERLADEELTLLDFLEREGLVAVLDRLAYFAHWITPPVEGRRYDTRFFLALAPEGQVPEHDERETTDGAWVRPEEALHRNMEGEVLLAPPTLVTLRQFRAFDSADEALEAARRRVPRTQLPHMESEDGEITLYLPADPEYPSDDPRYRAAEPAGGGPTRLRMVRRGQWEVESLR